MSAFVLAALTLAATVANAHLDDAQYLKRDLKHKRMAGHFVERQDPSPPTATYPTGPGYDIPPLASITPLSAEYDENPVDLPRTYEAGAQPPIQGAPVIPTWTFDPAAWPTEFQTPPNPQSPEVQEWLKELDGWNIPDLAPNPDVDCANPANAKALAEAGSTGRCWWTCGGCTRPEDVTTCKNQWDYGLTFDDGPGLYSAKLLTYLDAEQIKATFFVVGTRVINRPDVVVYEHMTGHELAVHTWSHSALTTLTNAEIVSELGWTRKAIKDITGVTPLMMRPPYGDIDDRVRAISLAMGLVPVIWTAVDDPATGIQTLWDSQDWRVHDPASNLTAPVNQASFENILSSSGQFDHGVVVLHHDIYNEGVDLAIGYSLPFTQSHNPAFNLQPVNICQGRPLSDAYLETNTNEENPAVQEPSAGGGPNTGTGTRTGTGASRPTGAPDTTGSHAFGLTVGSSVWTVIVAFGGLVAGGMLL